MLGGAIKQRGNPLPQVQQPTKNKEKQKRRRETTKSNKYNNQTMRKGTLHEK